MSYTKREWATGNVVGAVDLNRIENGIADIDVDEIRGWGVQNTQLFSETVTTAQSPYGYAAQLNYTTAEVPPTELTITLNGTDYVCTQQSSNSTFWYGASSGDFSIYPFVLLFESGHAILITQTAGTYAVSATGEVVEISTTFSDAVNSCFDLSMMPMQCLEGVTTLYNMQDTNGNKILYFSDGDRCHIITSFVNATSSETAVSFIPTDSRYTAGFDGNGIFTLYWNDL